MNLNEFGDPIEAAPQEAGPQLVPTEQGPRLNAFGDPIEDPPKPSARDKVILNAPANPDDAGKALGLAKRIPLPAGLIERNVPKYEKDLQRQDAVEAVQIDPNIASWVDKKPEEAKAANDEFPQIASLLKELKHFGSSFEQEMKQHLEKTIKDVQLAPSKWWAAEVNGEAPDFQENYKQMLAMGVPERQARDISAKLQKAKSFGLFGDVVWAPMNLVLTPVVAGLRAGITKPLEERTGIPSEVFETFFWVGLAGIGLGRAMVHAKEVPAPFRSTPEEIGSFVNTANLYTSRGKTTFQEVQEAMQPKVEPQKLLEGPKPERQEGAPSPATVEPHIPAIDDVGKTSLQANEVPRPGTGFVVDRGHAMQHTRDLEVFDAAFARAQELKLRERSPDALQSVLEEAIGKARVFIPAETVAKLYKDTEPHPDDGLLGWASNAEQKIATALSTGSDVQIPQAQFLARADPAMYDAIKDEIRFQETGINNEEMKEIQQKKPEDYDVQTSAPDQSMELLRKLQPELFEPKPAGPREEVRPVAEEPTSLEPAQETRKVKATANVGRVAALLGPSRYDKMHEMQFVTVKELFQNAFDAIKGNLEQGKLPKGAGKIDITVDKKTRTVAVQDNGTGMTPEVLGTQFIQIAGTSKETSQASGGFGIAKMLYAFNNTGMRVYTLRGGQMSILKTTGEELFATFQNPELEINLETRAATAEDKKMFPDGSGTRVEVDVPAEFTNPSDGEMKPIEFEAFPWYHSALDRSPLFHDIEVTFNKHPLDIGKRFPADNFTQFADVNFNWGTARIYVSKKENDRTYSDNMHILSNGLWQFSTKLKANPMEAFGNNVPRDFYIDVSPKVAPEESGYPFDLNRQQFSKSARDDFQQIFAYMSRLYQQVDLASSSTNFGSISYVGPDKGGRIVEQDRQVLQPPIPKKATPASGISEGDKISVVDGKLIVKGRVIPQLTKEEMAQAAIDTDELKVDQRLINPDRVIVHDNLMVPLPRAAPKDPLEQQPFIADEDVGHRSIVEAGRAKFPDRFDAYVYEVGKIFKDMRDVVSVVMEYPELAKEGIGVSFDSAYYGVSIRLPFSGSFINPALARFPDPVRAAVGMIGTMIHELAHHVVRSHNAEFPAEMQTIQIQLDYIKYQMTERLNDQPGYDLEKVKYNFIKFMEKNHDIFTYLNGLATGPNTKTSGKRLKEAGAYETRDAGAPRDLEGAGAEGLRPSAEGTGEGPTGGVPEGGAPETKQSRSIKREREALYLNPLFKSAKAAGIDEVRFKRYSTKVKAQDELENEKALAAAKRVAGQELTPEWKSNREEMQKEVETDLKSRPDIVADRYLRLGELPTGEHVERIKLSEAGVKRLGGEGLERYTAPKGKEPDDIAIVLGFANGTDLVVALNAYAKGMAASGKGPKGYFDQQVAAETDARMQAKYGGDLPARILDRARDIVTDATHLDVLTEELKILAEQGGLPFDDKTIPTDVKARFQNAVAQEVSYEIFRRGAERAGKDAEKALLKGDFRTAFQHKLQQFHAVLYAKEAKAFDKKMATGEKNFRKIDRKDSRGSIDQEAYDQANKILHDIGFTATPGQTPKLTIQQFIDENQGQAAVASWLSGAEPQRAGLKYENLTVGEWTALNNSIRSIMHVGGMNKKIDSVHGRANLDNFVFDVIRELERFGISPPWESQSYIQRAGAPWRFVKAAHVLVERMFDFTDKFDPSGPITQYIDRPLRDAYTKELLLQEQVVKRLKALQKYVDNSINDYIENTSIIDPRTNQPYPMTSQNLRYMMLHMGSESGINKVMAGFGIDGIAAWDLIRKNAKKNDVAWVNGMHELFDFLWKEGAEMQRRYTGVEADRVEARPYKMKLKDGTEVELTGGYAPLFYDKTRSNITGDLLMKGDLFDKNYIAAVPAHGYTIPRTEYEGWIDLNGTMMASKIQQQIHDIAFREAVRNAQKAISHPDFAMAFRMYWGDKYADLLPGWLRDIANVHGVDDSFAQGAAHVFSLVRQNITASLVALNPGTVIKHGITAAAMSVAQVKATNIASAMLGVGVQGVWRAAKDLTLAKDEPLSPEMNQALLDILRDENVREFIIASSPLFRNRSQQYPDTVRGAYERASSAGLSQTLANARDKILLLQRFPVALSDMVSAMPLWYAAYKEQMVKSGDHAEAVFQADRVVARAHGSSFIGDKPAVMRLGTGPMAQLGKSFVSLYNFWNHMANNMLQLGWDMGARWNRGAEAEPGATIASMSQRMFLYGVVAIFAEEIAAPATTQGKHGGHIREGFLATLRYFGGMIVGLREVTNAVYSGYEPSMGMIGVATQGMYRFGKDITNLGAGKAVSKNWIIHFFSALGIATGLGGPQVGRTVQGVYRDVTQKERPRTLGERKSLYRSGTIRR